MPQNPADTTASAGTYAWRRWAAVSQTVGTPCWTTVDRLPRPSGGMDGGTAPKRKPLGTNRGAISRVDFGEPRRTRTFNQLIKSQLLYH